MFFFGLGIGLTAGIALGVVGVFVWALWDSLRGLAAYGDLYDD